MGSTKIIHVLKNDDFDEVFDLFKNIEAEEVIFVFPKGSRFAKNEQYIEAIQREANTTGRKISIMTPDPIIANFASNLDIEVLETPEPKKSYRKVQEEVNEEEPKIQLAASKTESRIRIMKDIVRPEFETQQPIRVREEKTRPFEVEIKKEFSESKSRESVNDITQVWASREPREQENRQIFQPINSLKKIRTHHIFKKTPLFFIGGAVLVLFLILYGTLGNARIVIHPQKQPLDFQIKATASTIATSINFELNRLPGQSFGRKDGESGSSPATGQKDVVQKASGEITIYNKGSSPQILVATTRFKNGDGLIYRITKTITVPSATGSGTAFKEGSIKSAVFADKAGSEYNIGPATFTIPGFEGSPKFEEFYAKSDQPMTGGIIGPSKVVTEEDFAKLQETLTAKLKEKIKQSLEDQAGELEIVDSIAVKTDPPVSNAKAGEAAENLEMTISGSATTIAFRESDVLELIESYITKKGNLELLQKDLVISYSGQQNSADGSMMTFDVHVAGNAASVIDQEKILKEIAGMDEETIRNYFKNISEIESARIILSPFWVKSIPKDSGKITIEIERE